MQFKSLLFSAFAATSITARPSRDEAAVDRPFGCNAPNPNEHQLTVSTVIAEQESHEVNSTLASRQTQSLVIDTYFHVVAASTALTDGYVTQAMLDDQLEKLNTDFAPHRISFVLKGTDRTINSGWSTDGNELAMKRALRQGDYKTLNIYFLKQLQADAFGYAYFPDDVVANSSDYYYDGASIDFDTMPGGSLTDYNLGATATHEVGHWLGLYHTFQGQSCSGSGDLIADTPQQLSNTNGCPTDRDSCPTASGADPVHNYMDYSTDACYEEFTAGQETRIYSMWNQYRA